MMADRPLECRVTPRGISFTIRVKPRSSQNEIRGVREGILWVNVTAPPVEGAANRACEGLLADAFGVKRRQVRILSGDKSRTKIVEVEGLGTEDLARLLRENGGAVYGERHGRCVQDRGVRGRGRPLA